MNIMTGSQSILEGITSKMLLPCRHRNCTNAHESSQ